MTKKKKTLLAIGIAIVLGGVAYGGYGKYKEAQSTVKVQEHVEPLYQLEEVARVEYKADDLTTLERQGDIWINSDFPNLKYNQVAVNEWILRLQNLSTKQMVKNVQDETVYGIDDQSTMITLYDGTNQSQTIKIGNIDKTEDCVYVKGDMEQVIYIVSYEEIKDMLTRPNDFVDCTDVLKIPELQSIGIEYKSEKLNMVKADQWYLKDYYALPARLKEKSIEALVKEIQEAKLVTYVGTYENLEAYGIANPQLVLTLNENLRIAFGSQSKDNVYVTVNEGKEVYLMSQAFFKTLSQFKPYEAMDKQVLHVDRKNISEIVLVNPQGTYTLSFNGLEDVNKSNLDAEDEKVPSEDKEKVEDKEVEVEAQNVEADQNKNASAVAMLNEIVLDEEKAQAWLDKIEESLCIEAELQNPNIEQKEERKAEATIHYVLRDGETIQIELIPYDSNYYILRYNGKVEFAVNKEKVTKLFNQLTDFVKK